MASKTLGRIACPIKCGFEAAHVKLKTDKGEGKTAYPYVHCPSCGFQAHTKDDEQAGFLLAMTRPEKIDAPAPITPESGTLKPEPELPVPAEVAPPVAKPAYAGRFGGRP